MFTLPTGQFPADLTHASVGSTLPPLLAQIEAAFRVVPNVAHTLHGVRRIRQGSRGRRTSLFPSRKAGGAIPLESRLELAYVVILERDPFVSSYRTQAIQLALPGGQTAFPDFLVRFDDGRYALHEVKPALQHLSTDYHERCQLVERFLQSVGVGFQIVDTNVLPDELTLEWLLQRYVRGHHQTWRALEIELAAQCLEQEAAITLADAYSCLTANGLPFALADYLAFHRGWFGPAEIELEGAAV